MANDPVAIEVQTLRAVYVDGRQVLGGSKIMVAPVTAAELLRSERAALVNEADMFLVFDAVRRDTQRMCAREPNPPMFGAINGRAWSR